MLARRRRSHRRLYIFILDFLKKLERISWINVFNLNFIVIDWPSIFVAWILKAIILKYGGPLLYTRLRPFFLGLVLGAFGTAGIWLIIDLCTGMTGNRLISIS